MTTLLCLSSFLKGHEFLREAKRAGCRVLLLTVEKLRDAEWPMESIDARFLMPDLYNREHVLNAVSYLARTEDIARIVALDEFDLEMAAEVREHLRLPGLGATPTRYFRDKLAMRQRAYDAGLPVPEFVGVVNHRRVAEYLERVPGPWFLKPRTSASAIGIRRIEHAAQLWPILESLGDKQSHHLLERFVPGAVYHVDAVVWDGRVVFTETSGYVNPPFTIYHGGGLFATRLLERGGEEDRALRVLNARLLAALGLDRGAAHSEFIRGDDGCWYFLETAARVGGAYIADMVEAATGLNLWREWARVEAASARGASYAPPATREDYAGLLVSLARQEWPDLSGYTEPEIVERLAKRHHAGLIVASPSRERVTELLRAYMRRFETDFVATMPPVPEASQALD